MDQGKMKQIYGLGFYFVCILGLLVTVRAQNGTTTVSEVNALNAVFRHWGLSASDQWNISGEPCTGAAVDSTSAETSNGAYNPAIKCECNGTVCHIIQLKIYALQVVGEIPDELWTLTFLVNLNLGQNYLTGPLSASIGNLTRMQYLSLGINALSGELPKELGKLTDLRSLSFSTNNFSGPLPSDLAKLTRLEQLYIDSSGVSGAIPSTFAAFQNLQTVWASDIALNGSIPEFIGNWSKLTVLRFQGNSFEGPIPSTFSNLTLLTDLRISDLSNGSSSLAFLKNMKSLGFIINTHSSFAFSVLPSGWNCLQRNFPCKRNSPEYSSFAVKCGGPQIKSSSGILYEWDNETLGPANYYVTDRWAVSNVGRFGEESQSQDVQYKGFSLSQFANTLDSELFQTARLSAGSLRYYGLGLENGNYTVNLQFAEISIDNTPTWQSLGKRIFDIYVQGNLELQDFDIRKEAREVSWRAVQREFKTRVSENYLEIHLFWAGKGTCCVPVQGTYGPLISAISTTPDFTPAVGNNPPSSKKSNTGVIVGIVVPVAVVIFLSVFVLYCFFQRRKRPHGNYDEEQLGMATGPYTFSYAELKGATEDFNPANKLGEGGFGPVFKGTLNDGRMIAVKQLSVASHQGKSQFVTEIATTSAVQHRNLVKLYGCCIEGDKRLLVYEYLENKSLDQALFAGKGSLYLDWSTRFDICLGVARGLSYLHEESRVRIVHRDVKASNILLDSDLNPKISDFGLAKLYDDKKTHISTRVAGTIGYLAPEYAMRGHLTEKADVFGFGVVALEVVSGRPNSDSSLEEDKIYLLEWAWGVHENHHEIELVDANLSEFNEEEVKRVIGVALLCTQTSPQLRPSMSRVVAMLSGDIDVGAVTSRPRYLIDWKFNDTSFMSSDASNVKDEHSHYSSSTSTTLAANLDHSPINDTEPILQEIIGEGR
ncbi:LRR receptor-like serine/threonine-protein kinase [Actinidia chinensis var. chinensis]|uniref:non-specific serine/threonine protein kinase n=1 Tax=Actinidia chinensis var. chinensis TaxID=1590841 RepID=A0A2R6QTC1_ACTCC|nr:LRR receptor-like serine/threonine-protein kinase [Actinidia chinensis var. chinensis]